LNHVYSCTHGKLAIEEAIGIIRDFTSSEGEYNLFVGTDSQVNNGNTLFVTSIVVHRLGKGAIFFINRKRTDRPFTLHSRLIEEAYRSIKMARIINEMGEKMECDICRSVKCMTIDADVGENGSSRDVIKAIVGMVTAYGYACRLKPDCISIKAADKYTKARGPRLPERVEAASR